VNKTNRYYIPAFIVIILILASCTTTEKKTRSVDQSLLTDGVYQGWFQGGPNTVGVEVSIDKQKITQIVILKHDNLLGQKAETPVIQAILKTQSADVDAVSGATNSSHVIMNAVQDALEKSYKE